MLMRIFMLMRMRERWQVKKSDLSQDETLFLLSLGSQGIKMSSADAVLAGGVIASQEH